MTPTGSVCAIEIPADYSALGDARRELAATLDRVGWDRDESGRVLLAGCEAIANAIEHGSGDTASVGIDVEFTGAQLIIRVTDDGRAGAATPDVTASEPADDEIRGRGILIMNRLADTVTFRERQPAGTEVAMAFTPLSLLATPADEPARTA